MSGPATRRRFLQSDLEITVSEETTFTHTVQQYTCPKHGVQHMIGSQFDITLTGQRETHRKYCMDCMVEMFDAHCCQLTPIEPEEKAA